MTKILMMCVYVVLVAAGGTHDSQPSWSSQDIGRVEIPGSATYNEGAMIWNVRGAGSDIFGKADSFRYVYRQFLGDGSIIARIESFDKIDSNTKCGVMIRDTLEPDAIFGGLFITPENGVRFQYRTTAGANTDRTFVKGITAPLWIKVVRKGNQLSAYYASEKKYPVWKAMAERPQVIAMSPTVYVGLAVTSHVPGQVCKAIFSNVVVSGIESVMIDDEILADPKGAIQNAYQKLEQLGNWRENSATLKKHGNLIANSLFTIAKAMELSGEPASTFLPGYYRIARILPDSSLAVDALTQITIFDGSKGLEYALKRIQTKSKEDQDRFYVSVMKGYCNAPENPVREAVIRSFLEYIWKNSNFTLLDEAINGITNDEQATSICKSLIKHSMTEPSNGQTAVVALRYMALKFQNGQEDSRFYTQELARWVTTKFKDAKLTACAMAVLADTHYMQGHYVEAIEVFQPELFSGDQTESKMVENIVNTLVYYRANTLLQDTIDQGQIYQGLADKAGELGLNIVALHCQRKIAAIKGLSLKHFEKSAKKGLKYCESGPENEVWFWKGLVAAEGGYLGKAAAAYEHFIQGDGKSILAARAYYDIARAKMAIGEDAREWIAKSKALSPCDDVIQLERRLMAKVSPQS